MALDDVLNDSQAHQTTQHYETFTQPPGAATTNFHSFTCPRQAEFSLEDFLLPEHLEAGVRHITQMPTTFPIYGQSDQSETEAYSPSPANPTLPLPPPTHALKLRPSFFRRSFFRGMCSGADLDVFKAPDIHPPHIQLQVPESIH